MNNHDSEMIQYSKRLDDMLVSESERLWLKQEKPDAIRNEVFGSHYVLYNPQADTHAPFSVSEGGKMPWAGIQTNPWTLLSGGTLSKERWKSPCPPPCSCSSSADFRGLPCAPFAVHWAGIPAAVKMLFLCWEKKTPQSHSQKSQHLCQFSA